MALKIYGMFTGSDAYMYDNVEFAQNVDLKTVQQKTEKKKRTSWLFQYEAHFWLNSMALWLCF